ncbi:MAG TPA: ABC transporter ATP-binding protein [Chloroflexota bacterium]|nr:ABC transporter ATP-binding protein [Chloroflexota bacterium]
MLELAGLHAGYGQRRVLHDIDLSVEAGEIVAILGANGAGKTTTLRAISGTIVRSGRVMFLGASLLGCGAADAARLGIAHVPEGRGTMGQLTVAENLQLGAYVRRDKVVVAGDLERVFSYFPILRERHKQYAGTLSGGEQQMLAIGRSLMSKPKCLMLDEPSLGIAPLLVKTIFEKIVEINKELGLTILLVEQNANLALEVSHYGYVLETGKIILEDTSAALRQNEEVRAAYLGG